MANGFIRVKYTIEYENDVDLSAYAGMTVEQAVAHETCVGEAEIIELVSSADEDDLTVTRDIKYINE